MVSTRQEFLLDLQTALLEVFPSFEVFYWHDLDWEFEKNSIDFRDTFEEVKRVNKRNQKLLSVKVSTLFFTEDILTQGSEILQQLENAIVGITVVNGEVSLESNEKFVETKGKKSIKITVNCKVSYQESA
jgi:hypothetical protein